MEGELVIAGVSASKYFLPFILAEFLKLHPRVRPKLSILSKADTLKSLQNQSHSLVITGRIFEGLGARFDSFATHTLAVVASPTSRLTQHARISLNSLSKENLILPTEETSIRHAVNQVFSEAGLPLTPYMELGSYELIKQSIMAGLGIGILSTDAFRLEEHTGHLVRLRVEDFPIHKHWYCAYQEKAKLNDATRAFIDFLHSYPIDTFLKKIYSPNR